MRLRTRACSILQGYTILNIYVSTALTSPMQAWHTWHNCTNFKRWASLVSQSRMKGCDISEGLFRLESLYIDKTAVTDAGVKKLQQALPNCKISR